MNIEEFLAPISPDKPCGENLEYDADFQAMNQASPWESGTAVWRHHYPGGAR